jgi:hypothetical protein
LDSGSKIAGKVYNVVYFKGAKISFKAGLKYGARFTPDNTFIVNIVV